MEFCNCFMHLFNRLGILHHVSCTILESKMLKYSFDTDLSNTVLVDYLMTLNPFCFSFASTVDFTSSLSDVRNTVESRSMVP